MTRLMFDMEGNRVPTGANTISRRAREAFMDGVLPSWLTVSEGTATHFAVGATASPAGEGWLSNRGLVSLGTSGALNSRATIQGPLLDWQSFTAMILTARSFRYSNDDSTIQAEMGMKTDDGNYGLELRQTGGSGRATMRTINAGTITDTATSVILREEGLQTISIAIFPRSNEWAILREDQIEVMGTAPGWLWAAASGPVGASRLLRPRLSVQSLTAVVTAINVGDVELTLDCW